MSVVRKTIDEETAANWFLESDRLREKAIAEVEDMNFAVLVTEAHRRGSCLGHSKSAGKSRLLNVPTTWRCRAIRQDFRLTIT